MAGYNCGEEDCPHEHAHFVSVLSFHTTDALDEFIKDEQEHLKHQAAHYKAGEDGCAECADEDTG